MWNLAERIISGDAVQSVALCVDAIDIDHSPMCDMSPVDDSWRYLAKLMLRIMLLRACGEVNNSGISALLRERMYQSLDRAAKDVSSHVLSGKDGNDIRAPFFWFLHGVAMTVMKGNEHNDEAGLTHLNQDCDKLLALSKARERFTCAHRQTKISMLIESLMSMLNPDLFSQSLSS